MTVETKNIFIAVGFDERQRKLFKGCFGVKGGIWGRNGEFRG